MTNTREEVAVAEAIRPWLNRSSPNASQHVAEQASKAAIAASNSKYLAGLVEALKKASASIYENYHNGSHSDCEHCRIYNGIEEALNNLPEELRG